MDERPIISNLLPPLDPFALPFASSPRSRGPPDHFHPLRTPRSLPTHHAPKKNPHWHVSEALLPLFLFHRAFAFPYLHAPSLSGLPLLQGESVLHMRP